MERIREYETLLIIDGAYLKLGAKDLEKKKKRSIEFSENVVSQIVDYIQTKTGVFIDERVFISAEDDKTSIERLNKKKAFRECFEKNKFIVDMRSIVFHHAFCENKPACPYSKGKKSAGLSYPMQREVDIAIAMRPIRAKVEHPTMKNLILLAGDGDFTDMVKFMLNTYKVNVFIVGWSDSLNYRISELVQTVYLDELFETISMVKPGATLTNADRLKQDPLF